MQKKSISETVVSVNDIVWKCYYSFWFGSQKDDQLILDILKGLYEII